MIQNSVSVDITFITNIAAIDHNNRNIKASSISFVTRQYKQKNVQMGTKMRTIDN